MLSFLFVPFALQWDPWSTERHGILSNEVRGPCVGQLRTVTGIAWVRNKTGPREHQYGGWVCKRTQSGDGPAKRNLIAPNPATDRFTILGAKPNDVYEVRDPTGRTALRSTGATVDVSILASGHYVVCGPMNGQHATHHLVIE